MLLVNPNQEAILRQVAHLHKKYIDRGFLSKLGEDFLYCLYKAISLSDEAILVVYIEGGSSVKGFVAGAKSVKGLKKRMLALCKFKLIKVIPKLMSLERIKRFLETSRYVSSDLEGLPTAELLSIAVVQEMRGRGISQILYKELCKQFRALGVDSFKIVAGKSLRAAQRFYEKMGAKAVGSIELHKGEVSKVYIQSLK